MAETAEPLADSGSAPGPASGARALVQPGHSAPAEGPAERLGDVALRLSVNLGCAHVTIRDILTIARGSIVSLEKLSGEPVDICVNDELVAYGEVLVIQDKLRIRVVGIAFPPGHQKDESADA